MKTRINYPHIAPSNEQLKVSFSTNFLRLFALGQERLISSLLWIDTLIDADSEHYKGKDFGSWMYLRFRSISELDPYFYQNYAFGGLYLSIIKDDDFGAKDIYDRALTYYPNDLELLKNAAFHYRFELFDYRKALSLYEKASVNPDFPPYLLGIIARLRNHQNDIEGSLEIVKEMYSKAQEGSTLKERLFNYYYSLQATIDLDCLNQKLPNCNERDISGQAYRQNLNGEYQANREIIDYKLNASEKTKKEGD